MTAESPPVGVVGTGYWGKNLLRNFQALGALAALCESDAGLRAESGQPPMTCQPMRASMRCCAKG